MKDQDKNKQQLLEELAEMRHRVSVLEGAEEELRTSRATLQTTIDNLPFDFFAVGMDGRYMLQNTTSKVHWGDAVGKLPENAAGSEENLALWKENNRRAFAGEKVEEEAVLTIKGEKRYYHNVITPIIDAGHIQGILGMNVDITERKRAEEALHNSERTLRTLMDASPESILLIDANETILFANATMARRFGTTADKIVGRTSYDLVSPELAARRMERLQEVVRTGKAIRFEDERSGLHFEIAMHPIFDEQGKVTAVAVLAIDQTDRKRSEEALKQAHDELERQVTETRLNEARLEAVLQLSHMTEASLQEITDFSLEQAVALTKSKIGYLAFINEDETVLTMHSWSKEAMAECAISDKPLVYPLETTGLWGEAVRQRKPIVTNDYVAPNPLKKGLPEGHVELGRHMNVPILDGGHIVIVAGVGNKGEDYDESDVRQLTLLMEGMWTLIQRQRVQTELQRHRDHLEKRVEERTAELTKANEELAVFRRFVEASGQGFGMARLNGQVTYVNPAISRLFADERPENIIGNHVSTYYPKEYMEKREKEILPSILRDGHWEGEVVFSIPSGSIVVLQNSFLVRDEQGNPAYLATVLTDITERKQADEALQQAHDQLQAIYDGMVDGLLVTDIETLRFIRTNASLCQMLGYSETELRSLSVMDLHPAEALPDILENIRLVKDANQTTPGDIPFLRKDGSVFYAEVIGKFLTYNGRPCSMGIFRDITERKQAQAALRASEERYDLVVRGAGTGIWDWDIRTGKLYFSPRWKAIFGYGEKDIGDSLEDWARLLHPDEKDWMLKFLKDFLAGTSPTVTVEYRLRHKDGSYRWIVAHGLVLRDEQGKAYRFVGSHGDITDRKHAEEMLRREHRTLKHLLQASDHERQLIAYEIHDELAQQLAGAIMQFDTFAYLKKAKPKQAEDAFHAAMTMLRQGHFETRRLIAGVRPPILDESGVATAVGHLVNEQNRLKGTSIEYHSRVSFGRLVPTLENSMYRIAQEGLANACQHSKSEKVRVRLVQREDRVRIEIRDWGIGFDTKSVKENHFGLEGIRQRVRLLGGKCRIQSNAGKGTRILVELPVVERE